jgi:sugar lactone lactonase YvrE
LEIADEEDSGAAGLTVDTEGFLYVCTRLGLQINDPAGRTSAVLLNPNGKALTSVTFGGPGLDTLYVTAGDSVFRRKTKRQGVFPWAVLKPPVPRL